MAVKRKFVKKEAHVEDSKPCKKRSRVAVKSVKKIVIEHDDDDEKSQCSSVGSNDPLFDVIYFAVDLDEDERNNWPDLLALYKLSVQFLMVSNLPQRKFIDMAHVRWEEEVYMYRLEKWWGEARHVRFLYHTYPLICVTLAVVIESFLDFLYDRYRSEQYFLYKAGIGSVDC
ncbi:hypothetical protein Tco_0104756 [Tanacetum coccineum]